MWEKKNGLFPSIHLKKKLKDKLFLFESHKHIGEIRMDILGYNKGGVIRHIKAPARVKVKLLDL